MPVDLCRHLVGKTLRNFCQVSDHVDIFLYKLIQFYFNNTINLGHLTQCIMSCYGGRVVALDTVTSLHLMYKTRRAEELRDNRAAVLGFGLGLARVELN